MKKEKRWSPRFLLTASVSLAAGALIAACGPSYEATGSPESPDAVEERTQRRTAELVQVEIMNSITPAGEAEVYALPENGTRNYLALVDGGETTTIEFAPTPDIGQRYRLLAVVGGTEIESDTFVPADATHVSWDIDSNEVTFESPSETDAQRREDPNQDPDQDPVPMPDTDRQPEPGDDPDADRDPWDTDPDPDPNRRPDTQPDDRDTDPFPN